MRLIFIDADGLSAEARAELDREVAAILAAAGASVDLATPEEASGVSAGGSAVTLKVVLLAEDGRRFGVGDGHMGANLIVEGAPSDTVYVFVPVVREALGSRLRTGRRRAQVLIGRALGRVTAHELVHALAPDVPHVSSGLMKSAPNMRDLIVPDVRLDPGTSERFRQALVRRSDSMRRR